MKMDSYVVFGLGKFGQSVADKLIEGGVDVMVVDNDEETIEKYSESATSAIVADLTDANAIKALGVSNIDCAIVAMGMSLEASIMCVMVAKECGVKRVVAKAGSDRMGKVLTKVGADQIVFPEEESGIRTAKSLMSSNFLEFFDVSDDICIVEMEPKKDWVGKNLKELNLRQKYGANVVAVRDGAVKETVDPDVPLKEGEPLVILVHKKNVDKLDR